MNTRRLGKTGLFVSEIGFGGEWMESHPEDESIELIRYAASQGVNLLDCWMPDPKSRDIVGKGIHENRAHWIIQGHVGSTWKEMCIRDSSSTVQICVSSGSQDAPCVTRSSGLRPPPKAYI